MSVKLVDIVFDGPPSHKSGRFVEVEDQDGKSIQQTNAQIILIGFLGL